MKSDLDVMRELLAFDEGRPVVIGPQDYQMFQQVREYVDEMCALHGITVTDCDLITTNDKPEPTIAYRLRTVARDADGFATIYHEWRTFPR